MRSSVSSLVRVCFFGLLSAACLDTTAAPAASAADATRPSVCPHDDSGLTLPSGFCASVFADDIGHARHLVVSPDGVVYVNTWSGRYYGKSAPPAGGFLVALPGAVAGGTGVAASSRRFGETLESGGAGGTGIGLYKGFLYAEINDKIVRYRMTPGSVVPSGAAETIVSGLPLEGDHPMHPFAIDAAGTLYVDVASATNSCQVKNRTLQSPGAAPCEELLTRGGIWAFDANRPGQVFSAKQRFATGIRNGEGIAVDNAGHRLFVTQHGRDQLHANWPGLYAQEQEATLPAEQVMLLTRDADYGWPQCYYDPGQKKLVLAPEYGGDGGTAVGPCAGKRAPLAAYPAHWAPDDLLYYDQTQFPAHYRKGLFVAFHGSWDRAPYGQAGYNVVFQSLRSDGSAGQCEVFADGFAGPSKSPGGALHRPSGLALGPDGALYVADDVRGRIYRIVYAGGVTAGPAPAAVPCPDAAAGAGPLSAIRDKPPEGTDPDDAAAPLPVPPGATAEMVALGKRIFQGEVGGAPCTGCHGAAGGGTPLGPNLTGKQWLWSDGSPAGIATTITRGVSQPKQYRAPMPAMGGAQLTPEQVSAVAAYVWALSHGPPPSAAAPPVITLPGEKLYPESLTSTADGRVIIGSIGARAIFSAEPGSATAEPWIAADSDTSLGVYGVLADEKSGTLWACFSPAPGTPAASQSRAALKAFDLHSGKFESRYELPADNALCNDIAVAPGGTVYVTDSRNMEIDRLQGRDQQLQLWSGDGDLGPKGGILDGIAVLGDRVLVNALQTGKLLSVAIGADGEPGTITEIKTGRPLERPDGMRASGPNELLLVESGGVGRLDRLTLSGDSASLTTLKEGFLDGPVAATVVGQRAYVLEGQLAGLFGPANSTPQPKPFYATAVDLPQ